MNRQTAVLYAPLVAALAAGRTIQANRGSEEAPNWVILGDDVEFSCPPHLYRVEQVDMGANPMSGDALRAAGQRLSNVAYNLAQSPAIAPREREILDQARKDWDAALTADAAPVGRGGEVELPPLPNPCFMPPEDNGDYQRGYYAEQVQDYAREAVEHDRARSALAAPDAEGQS